MTDAERDLDYRLRTLIHQWRDRSSDFDRMAARASSEKGSGTILGDADIPWTTMASSMIQCAFDLEAVLDEVEKEHADAVVSSVMDGYDFGMRLIKANGCDVQKEEAET